MPDQNATGAYRGEDASFSPGLEAIPPAIGRYRIDRIQGKGGFGLVYLAHDGQLQRPVAIKVPHRQLVDRHEAADAYLTEARTAANLDHPNIVPVYDVGGTDDCPFFIVSKYIDGTDLAARLKLSRLPQRDAVELVATVAEALHFAHRQGLVHRDIKPGNLLIDRNGKPFVTDFGLALREQDVGRGPRYAGTPAYMSPEQARGEGHRVDGRSDVFSLGVVFYELLGGRQPFRADSRGDLMDQIATHEPRPLRQIDETVPKELERICFKAMAKRASERYMTAKDLAEDLRFFLAERVGADTKSSDGPAVAAAVAPSTAGGSGNTVTPSPPSSDRRPVRIVPKGLRSFDAHDADFFLELLAGPRDRDGLPDSLRFWKTRIEERDADATFPVGLIYGPSGCGKSSLAKAGLLPRLSSDVIAVYLEATAEETETRLLNALRKRCPSLSEAANLTAALADLRRGWGVPVGKKVVIVLDQFEQWLHAQRAGSDGDRNPPELVQALRQCDGGRLQCVVMVRDDFWMAATRFMRALEVRLIEAQNSAAVDLFPVRHAERVLAAFGRAFGALPDGSAEVEKDQKQFIEQAVTGLSQEGKVVCVRLALFAEMMKGKPWTPAALKAVGGTDGIGVTFLEETFSAATAPPEHRYHQHAARAVLKLLLPETGSDIKGHMRSHAELLDASGYRGRRTDFDDLIRILDGEIRLITPTDPEGKDDVPAAPPSGQKYYQLTHDYLVASLRDWLTKKQKETRRGRAELRLADRTAEWTARPENRQLPSLAQWFTIRRWTRKKNWTPPQRKMMAAAARVHAVRGGVLTTCLVLVGLFAREANGRLQARVLRDRVLGVTAAETPAVVKDMAPFRRWVDPLLRAAFIEAEQAGDARKQLHAGLALLPTDAGQVNFLYDRLLKADPTELVVIREALAAHKGELTGRLWELLSDPAAEQDVRLRGACALARFAADDPRWANVGRDIAATLVIQKPFVIASWTDALKGAGRWLIPSLTEFLTDDARGLAERGLIASVYATFAADAPDAYGRLNAELMQTTAPEVVLEAQVAAAKRRANIGMAMLVIGRGEEVWPLLKHTPDPTVRGFLIDRLAPGGVDVKVLVDHLDSEQETSVRRAVLQCLGEFGPDRVSLAERRTHYPRLLALYRNDRDAGIHAAAGLVLRRWGAADQVQAADADLSTGTVEGTRTWFLNRQGLTLVVIPPPGEFRMGEGDGVHRRRIDRTFAIASKEVTLDQFLRFRQRHDYNRWFARTGDCPAVDVTWYDAAAYCNWLSEREGIPKNEWCYAPNTAGNYAEGMTTAPDYLKRTGYRLPTEAEWDYACRAGSESEFSFGMAVELLGKYGWFDGSSLGTSHPVASLRPNDFGLFDMHGNTWEWCQDIFREQTKLDRSTLIVDGEAGQSEDGKSGRVLRGGSFNNQPNTTRTANRNGFPPATRDDAVGLRPARTIRH